jgi:hypothetical protein
VILRAPRADFIWRRAPWIGLGIACLAAFLWKLRIVAPIAYVGHADAAGYAEMAHSIIQGRGLEVDYISWFFRKYDAGIVRPEDHWPPFYSFLIAPFFLTMGRTALAAKMPSLLISAFTFPGVTTALAWRVSRSRAVAFAAGLCVLLYTPIFSMSLHALSDVTFGALVVAAIWCAVVAATRPRWHVASGVLLACAYYAKGSTLVLAPAFVLYYLVRRRHEGSVFRRQPADVWFVAGWAAFSLLLAPWALRNQIHFGEPLYSTQSHAAGYIGWKSWEEGTYALYWGDEAPALSDKLHDPARLARTSVEHAKRHVWWLFMRHGKAWGDFSVADISTYWLGAACLLGSAWAIARYVVGTWARRPRADLTSRGDDSLAPYALFALVACAHVAFLSVCWEPISRLLMPLLPLVIIAGWHTIHGAVAWLGRGMPNPKRFGAVVVLCLLTLWCEHEGNRLLSLRQNGGYAWKESGQGWMATGRWLAENAPNSVTMTRNPWELHFYSQEKAVQIPLAPLARIREVARFYGVTHLIAEANRPTLAPLLSGEVPGAVEVFRSSGVVLYAFDPDAAQ